MAYRFDSAIVGRGRDSMVRDGEQWYFSWRWWSRWLRDCLEYEKRVGVVLYYLMGLYVTTSCSPNFFFSGVCVT